MAVKTDKNLQLLNVNPIADETSDESEDEEEGHYEYLCGNRKDCE